VSNQFITSNGTQGDEDHEKRTSPDHMRQIATAKEIEPRLVKAIQSQEPPERGNVIQKPVAKKKRVKIAERRCIDRTQTCISMASTGVGDWKNCDEIPANQWAFTASENPVKNRSFPFASTAA
jgi:hypothetical protein